MDETVESAAARGGGEFWIILAGLVTSAATLAVTFALAQADISVMGYYVNWVIPVGAIGAGLVAGSGYALATWLKGVKVGKWLCLLIVAFQVACYFEAQVLDFRRLDLVYEDGTRVGFWEYFDFSTRSFAWKQRDGSLGEPLGLWGYALRGLEVTGFGLGGLIGALILRAKPYCERCRRYMKSVVVTTIPAAPHKPKAKKNEVRDVAPDLPDKAAAAAAVETAAEKAGKTLERLIELAGNGDVEGFDRLAEESTAAARTIPKGLRRLQVHLVHCPTCSGGRLRAVAQEGKGDKTAVQEVGTWEAPGEFVRGLLERRTVVSSRA